MEIKRIKDKFLSGYEVKSRCEKESTKETIENFILKVTPLEADTPNTKIYIIVEVRMLTEYVDKELTNAKMAVNYSLLNNTNGLYMGQKSGDFSATYEPTFNSLSLTDGGLFLDPPKIRGNRIGTYFFDRIIEWAKTWEDVKINKIELSIVQAKENNTERRNKFYERFGIEFDYTNNKKSGVSKPIKIEMLKRVDTWEKNIKVIEPADFLNQLMAGKIDLDHRLYHQNELIKDYKYKKNQLIRSPLTAGITIFLNKYVWFFRRFVHSRFL